MNKFVSQNKAQKEYCIMNISCLFQDRVKWQMIVLGRWKNSGAQEWQQITFISHMKWKVYIGTVHSTFKKIFNVLNICFVILHAQVSRFHLLADGVKPRRHTVV